MELYMLITGHGVITDEDGDNYYIRPMAPEKADLIRQWVENAGLVDQTEEE